MDQPNESIGQTEMLNATPGPNTEGKNVETPSRNESTSSVMADKRKSNVKNKIGYDTSKITNAESKKLKAVPEPDSKSLKRKAAHPPISEMVMDSIKALKKRHGATFDDIKKHMEEKYTIDMKVLKSHVNKFLQKSTDNGILERVEGASAEGRFKIKKPETTEKSSQNLKGNVKERKTEKKKSVSKKQVKK